MTALSLLHTGDGPLVDLSLRLDAGIHAVLGSPADGTAVLVELIAGLRRPRRGRVSVDGQDPACTPTVRRRIGTLLHSEPTPAATTVQRFVERALALRGNTRSAADMLEEMELESWAGRRIASLSSPERRSVALVVALGVSAPAVLALHEPLADLPGHDLEVVLRRLQAAATGGACVLAITASPRHAARLSDAVWVLNQGRLARRAVTPLAVQLTPGTTPDLVVRTPAARELAARLVGSPEVTGISWSADGSGGELRVTGDDLERLSITVMQAATEGGVEIAALVPALPPLQAVQAASAGLARGAYERALELARTPAAPTPSGPADRGTT